MVARGLIVIALLISVGLTSWYGRSFESSTSAQRAGVAAQSAELELRQELIETLDRVVTYQHYYRSVYGHYTRLLGKVGYAIPATVSDAYDIRVIEASSERLLVTASAEQGGVVSETIAIDQDYRVRASFELPPPREEFLRSQALRHLKALRDSPSGRSVAEAGVYRDYFRFDLGADSQSRRVAVAVGIKAPVQGLRLDVEAREADDPEARSQLTQALGLGSRGGAGTGETPSERFDEEYLRELSRLTQALPETRQPASALEIERIEVVESERESAN